MHIKVEREISGRTLSLETGKLAKQATSSVVVQYGGTVILAASVLDPEKTDFSFVPFAVDYMERSYAAGIIRGSRYNKREGRLTDAEILSSRMIDRPLRPFFADDYRVDTRVQIMVFSTDNENDPAKLAMVGAAAALRLAPGLAMPSVGTAKVGKIDGQLVLNPPRSQLADSDFHLILSGTRDRIVMVEFEGKEVPDDEVMEAIAFGHQAAVQTVDLIEELAEKAGAASVAAPTQTQQPAAYEDVSRLFGDAIRDGLCADSKAARNAVLDELRTQCQDRLAKPASGITPEDVAAAFQYVIKRSLRHMAAQGQRCDGRGLKDVRPISCHVGVLPKAHGSALFARGETQTLVATTIGTRHDEQRMEELTGERFERFMLHYNFPPFCVGEVGWIRGPSRRDIGHGYLAKKGLVAVMPSDETFPYTIRVVSDVLESCASSSMASVCGTSLSLMDAGVPISAAVAGVSIGLVEEDGQATFLTDIMDEEDFNGDMDFKVAGTSAGITAIQMDVKNSGVTLDMASDALAHAKEARAHILPIMAEALAEPRPLSRLAPRVINVQIEPELIGKIIGPGGVTIRGLVERTGAEIDVADDGTVHIVSEDATGGEDAAEAIRLLAQEPKLGVTYDGVVTGVKPFGAFVEVMPGTEGLLHVNDLADEPVRNVDDVVKIGDKIRVTVFRVDRGKVSLTREGVEPHPMPQGGRGRPPRGDGRRDGPRSGRGRDGDRDRRDGPPRRDERGRGSRDERRGESRPPRGGRGDGQGRGGRDAGPGRDSGGGRG